MLSFITNKWFWIIGAVVVYFFFIKDSTASAASSGSSGLAGIPVSSIPDIIKAVYGGLYASNGYSPQYLYTDSTASALNAQWATFCQNLRNQGQTDTQIKAALSVAAR